MDLNAMLFGGPGGLWNQGADKAAEQIRLGEQQDRELAQVLSQIKDREARLAMAQDLHPIDMRYQGSRADAEAAQAQLNRTKAKLEDLFGMGREQDAAAARQQTRIKTQQEIDANAHKNFVDEFAQLAGARGPAGVAKQEVEGIARRYGLDPSLPQVQMFASAPPQVQNDIAQRVAASSIAQRQRDEENKRIMDRQTSQELGRTNRALQVEAARAASKAALAEQHARALVAMQKAPKTFAEAIIRLKLENEQLRDRTDPDADKKLAANNEMIQQYTDMILSVQRNEGTIVPSPGGGFEYKPPKEKVTPNLTTPKNTGGAGMDFSTGKEIQSTKTPPTTNW